MGKKDDFYDSYDDNSGKGVIIIGACILGIVFLIISISILISEKDPVMFIIVICYIIGISLYIYYQKKNSKLSDDFIPTNKSKEQLMDEYVANHKFKEKQQERARVYFVNAQAQELLNKPHCPTCNSTNLSKISNIGKAAKIGMFGIFGAGDLGKTWKCNNCGSKF